MTTHSEGALWRRPHAFGYGPVVNWHIMNDTGIQLLTFAHYKVTQTRMGPATELRNTLDVVCCGSGLKDHKTYQRAKKISLLTWWHPCCCPVLSLGYYLRRFVKANCKLVLLVFDPARGLYPKADDNTGTGQRKSKFICSAKQEFYMAQECHVKKINAFVFSIWTVQIFYSEVLSILF